MANGQRRADADKEPGGAGCAILPQRTFCKRWNVHYFVVDTTVSCGSCGVCVVYAIGWDQQSGQHGYADHHLCT